MMGSMKAPQEWDAVIQAMPKIHPCVEQEKRADHMRPIRQRQAIQQSEIVSLSPLRSRPPQRDKNETGEQRVEDTQHGDFSSP